MSCGDEEREGPVVVPLIVGLVPIRVDPRTVIVAVRVEHVRIAVRNVRSAIRTTAHRRLFRSQGCIVFVIVITERLAPSSFIF